VHHHVPSHFNWSLPTAIGCVGPWVGLGGVYRSVHEDKKHNQWQATVWLCTPLWRWQCYQVPTRIKSLYFL